ncbi:MAG: alpha/beta hydrolase [Candidatus Rhabdochlamydia sp.]
MIDVKHAGPPLEEGPSPAVFYFTLKASDSLETAPLNTPVIPLLSAGVRVFSVTLPYHDTLPPQHALEAWFLELDKNRCFLTNFIEEVALYIDHLHQSHVITSVAVMGISRGAFIAAHVAAKLACVKIILGFAPLSHLSTLLPFQHTHVDHWDLPALNDQLYHKTIRCYIGNLDRRVSPMACFNWLHQLAHLAHSKQIRSPPIELCIKPSIGRDGHGTSEASFMEGAKWLLHHLLS